MILGLILRNFKVYKKITYIPVSNNNCFSGLIGQNGIGKSSILEALDYYFNANNNKNFKKNNIGNPKSEDCYVVPIFCLSRDVIEADFSNYKNDIYSFNDSIWNILNNFEEYSMKINSNYQKLISEFFNHIRSINTISKENYCIIPIGMDADGCVNLGFFKDEVFMSSILNTHEENLDQKSKQDKIQNKYKKILYDLRKYFQYVFIPKDIEPENLIRFETQEIQTLLDKSLNNIISEHLSKDSISSISAGLKSFIDDLSSKLPNYKFKVPSTYQPNLKVDNIYKLIVQDFFSLRQLHKEGKNGKNDLPLSELSSGEKQQAILTLVQSIVKEYRNNDSKKLIIAIDEPESSLHISACYEQFEKLYDTSTSCCQILISSHWYGFIPSIINGTVTNITHSYSEDRIKGHIFNIQKYREEIRHKDREYSKEFKEQLPIDIYLKSSNDFIQSILMSVISEHPYNWIICEGSSDKIYFDTYFKEEISDKNLRIIPVCTASEVKNTYNRLKVLFDELKSNGQLKGKVFLLTDTDANPIEFDTEDNLELNLRCRRIVNSKKDTMLVKIMSNPKGPNTDIEDALNGLVFFKTLLYFKNNGYETALSFISEDSNIEEYSSYYALDLRDSERNLLDTFFNENKGNNKVLFAEKYIEILNSENYKIPNWINEIKSFFN